MRDVALFVGEEEPQVAVAADQVLALQPVEAGFNGAFEGELVGINAVQAQGGQVVDRAFDGFGITNQEQGAQKLEVKFFETGVVCGLVDGALDGGVQKAFDGRVKVVQRHQDVGVFVAVEQCRCLESVQHGALAFGQVAPGGPHFADGLKDFLQQLKLVGGKRVMRGEVFGVLKPFEGDGVVGKGKLVVDDVALGLPNGFELRAGFGRFLQQAVSNDFVGVGAGERQAGVETALNFGEVVGAGVVGFTQGGVDVFLTGDDDPCAAFAAGAQLLGDGLQVEHELGVLPNELPHLVDQKDHAVRRAFGLQVLVDQVGKAFDVDLVAVTGFVEPLACRLGAHAQGLAQTGDDFVAHEVHSVALGFPGATTGGLKSLLEGVEDAFADQVSLHVGHMGRIARQALHFVEHAQEDLQDGVTVVFGIGLGVDVEQDDVGVTCHGAADIAQQHGVFDLGLKELDCFLTALTEGIAGFDVAKQVRQDLDEVRFTAAEEAGHPNAHARGDSCIVWVGGRGQVGVEELAQVFGDLFGGDVFVQFLPDAFFVTLVGFDHAVDRAVDRFDE